jgi:hypothetical protein
MKKMILSAAIVFISLASFSQTSILEVVAPAGGFFTASNFSVSWTLGEPVTETWVNQEAGIMVTSGFQQGNLFATSAPVNPTLGFGVKIYPNPARIHANISITLPAMAEITITVLDITGRTVKQDKFIPANLSHIYELNVSTMKSGLYLVRVNSGAKFNKVIKLVVEQ